MRPQVHLAVSQTHLGADVVPMEKDGVLGKQEQLGDVVFVELPAAGKQVAAGGVLGNIESVKAVSEVFAPVGGEVVAANGELEAHPELVNQDPYGKGWLVRMKAAGAPAGLMDAAAYEKFLAEESH